jgi:hypothetical protein
MNKEYKCPMCNLPLAIEQGELCDQCLELEALEND